MSVNVTTLTLCSAVRTSGRLAPGDRFTVRELIRGTTLVTGALMARSLSAIRPRSSRISPAFRGNPVMRLPEQGERQVAAGGL